MEKNCFDVALKIFTKINKRSPSNKTVALRKKLRINNSRGYYYSIGKSTYLLLSFVDFPGVYISQ